MSFQLPNALVLWNCCKGNKRLKINHHGERINSEYPALKHEII